MRHIKRFITLPAGTNLLRTLLVLIFGWLILHQIGQILFHQDYPPGYDARSYIAGATALHKGYSPYEKENWDKLSLDYVASYYLYPPLLAILLIPISRLPIDQATNICIFLSFISAIVFFWVFSRKLDWKLALIAIFAFPPTWSTIYYGQINFLVATFLVLSVLALESDKQISLGIYLFAGALLKITPIISAIFLFFRGYKRSFIAGLAVTAAIVLITLPIANLRTWMESVYFALTQNWQNPDLTSWTSLMVYHLPIAYGRTLSLIVSLTFTIYTAIRINKVPPTLALSATILLPLLIAQIVWYHHAVMALAVIFVFWKQSPGFRAAAILSWMAIAALGPQAMPMIITFCWIISCWPEVITSLEKHIPPMKLFGSNSAGA